MFFDGRHYRFDGAHTRDAGQMKAMEKWHLKATKGTESK
jgi:hypothetical protein